MVKEVNAFSRLTEMEKSSISNRSTKLFTLSAIKNASKALLSKGKGDSVDQAEKELAASFWSVVAENMPDWQLALEKKVASAELREQYVHAHAVILQALGNIGSDLLVRPKGQWSKILEGLREIDWARANDAWEGRAMHHGRISKARSSVVLTGNYIKQQLGLALTPIEQEYEESLK